MVSGGVDTPQCLLKLLYSDLLLLNLLLLLLRLLLLLLLLLLFLLLLQRGLHKTKERSKGEVGV